VVSQACISSNILLETKGCLVLSSIQQTLRTYLLQYFCHLLSYRLNPWSLCHSCIMSEYWVSKKRYWCKYCETYIADDVPSRQQHENGLRHKGNKERFVRGLYKQAESKKKDEAEERREMARIDQVGLLSHYIVILRVFHSYVLNL
jgi:hypothetical protein